MEFTDYANFLQAKKEFDGIIRILRLYEKQTVAISSWATTIWTNLKPNLLLEAIEDNIQDFRQLEEWVSIGRDEFSLVTLNFLFFVMVSPAGSTASRWQNFVHGHDAV